MEPPEIEEERVLQEEILQFVTGDLSYYAVTTGGLRLDIMRSTSFQPPIENPDDYYSYLWLETVQGFFLLQQRIIESKPEAWLVIKEVIPKSRYNFYFLYLESLRL